MSHSVTSLDGANFEIEEGKNHKSTRLLVEKHRVKEDVDPSFLDVMLTYKNENAPPCKLTLLDVTRLLPNRYIFPELIRFAFHHALKERIQEATRTRIALIDEVNFPPNFDKATQEEKDKFHEQYPLQGKQWLVMPCFWEGTSQRMPHWYLIIVSNIQKIMTQCQSKVVEEEEEVVVADENGIDTRIMAYHKTVRLKIIFLNSSNPVGAVHYRKSARHLRSFLSDARLRATGIKQKIIFQHDYPKKIPQQNVEGDSGLVCVEYFVAYFKLPPPPSQLDIESERAEENRITDVRRVNPNAVSRTRYQLIIYQLITDREKRAHIAKHLNWNVLRVPKDGLMMVNGATEQRVTAEQLVTLLNTGNIVPGCASNSAASAAPRAIALAIDQPVVQVLLNHRITTTIERVN